MCTAHCALLSTVDCLTEGRKALFNHADLFAQLGFLVALVLHHGFGRLGQKARVRKLGADPRKLLFGAFLFLAEALAFRVQIDKISFYSNYLS